LALHVFATKTGTGMILVYTGTLLVSNFKYYTATPL